MIGRRISVWLSVLALCSSAAACSSSSGAASSDSGGTSSDTGGEVADAGVPLGDAPSSDADASPSDVDPTALTQVTATVSYGGAAEGTLTCPATFSFVRASDGYLHLHEDDTAAGSHMFFVDATPPDAPPIVGKAYRMADLKNPDSGMFAGGREWHARAADPSTGDPVMGDMLLTFTTPTSGTIEITMGAKGDPSAPPLNAHLTFGP